MWSAGVYVNHVPQRCITAPCSNKRQQLLWSVRLMAGCPAACRQINAWLIKQLSNKVHLQEIKVNSIIL